MAARSISYLVHKVKLFGCQEAGFAVLLFQGTFITRILSVQWLPSASVKYRVLGRQGTCRGTLFVLIAWRGPLSGRSNHETAVAMSTLIDIGAPFPTTDLKSGLSARFIDKRTDS